MYANKPTIQLVWGESGLFVHVTIPLKNRLPALDLSLRSLMDYAVSSFSPKLPPKTAYLGEWFDGPSYEAVYDVAKDDCRLEQGLVQASLELDPRRDGTGLMKGSGQICHHVMVDLADWVKRKHLNGDYAQ